MWKIFELIGRYFMLMGKVFSRPEKAAIYRRRIIYEMESLGIDSIGLTAIISVFIGAVITLQMCINLDSPFIPRSLVGYATRETMILEFSSTVVALILAGTYLYAYLFARSMLKMGSSALVLLIAGVLTVLLCLLMGEYLNVNAMPVALGAMLVVNLLGTRHLLAALAQIVSTPSTRRFMVVRMLASISSPMSPTMHVEYTNAAFGS